MKRTLKFIAFLFCIILGPKFSMGQYALDFDSVIAKETKDKVNESGEVFEPIVIAYKDFDIKGRLRILKTKDSNKFTYVQIGQWIYDGRHPTISGIGKVHFRDTTTYDSLGNATLRVYYSGKKDRLNLKKRQTLEKNDGRFVQHTQYFKKNNTVRRNYYEPIIDFAVPNNWDYKIVPR